MASLSARDINGAKPIGAGTVGAELLSVDFGAMIFKIAEGIANAQVKLNYMAVQIAQLMAGQDVTIQVPDPNNPGKSVDRTITGTRVPWPTVANSSNTYSMLELGFSPNFYQFADTIIEIKVAFSMSSEESSSESTSLFTAGGGYASVGFAGGFAMAASTMNASYAQKYNFHGEGSSLVRTKIVPVPAPPVFEQRLNELRASSATGT